MLQFLLDTDHVTLLQHRDPRLLHHLAAQPPDAVGTSIVTVEEALRGRLAALSRARDGALRILQYRHLLETLQFFGQLRLVTFDQASEDRFQQFRALRLRIGTQDLKIAGVAAANNLTLLTRNQRDFRHLPGLLLDDWSV